MDTDRRSGERDHTESERASDNENEMDLLFVACSRMIGVGLVCECWPVTVLVGWLVVSY